MTTTPASGDTETDEGRPNHFAAQLNRLFDIIRPPGRGPYTSSELIEWAQRGGMALSGPYLSQLRTGGRQRPSAHTIAVIAEFFGINSEYFTEPDSAYTRQLEIELRWLHLANNPDVRSLTTTLLALPANTRERVMAAAGI